MQTPLQKYKNYFFQLKVPNLKIKSKPWRDWVVVNSVSRAFDKKAVKQTLELDSEVRMRTNRRSCYQFTWCYLWTEKEKPKKVKDALY